MSEPSWPSGAARVARESQGALDRVGIDHVPFFTDLSQGQMTLARFAETQYQFSFAVAEFARPLLALLARMAEPSDRLGLLDNVVEEHGQFDPRRFHAATFRNFCASLPVNDVPEAWREPGPVVSAFNLALWGACQAAPIPTALGCLGTIEWAFARISARIGQAVVAHGWVTAEQLVHYRLHAELDVEHAGQMFRPLESTWDDRTARADARRGLELGAYLFDRLYRDLYPPHGSRAGQSG